MIGIKAADKTVLTGSMYDEHGREVDVPDLMLTTVDGRVVPHRGRDFDYPHLGRRRCANASTRPARCLFKAAFRGGMRKLRRLKFTARRVFLLVSDAFISGSAGFHLQETFLTFNEADK